jgi:hypothetical protein
MANLSLSWRREHVVGGPWAGRGVVLVRDPARAVLAYWNYWIMRSHVATADVTTRQSAIFEDFSTTGEGKCTKKLQRNMADVGPT